MTVYRYSLELWFMGDEQNFAAALLKTFSIFHAESSKGILPSVMTFCIFHIFIRSNFEIEKNFLQHPNTRIRSAKERKIPHDLQTFKLFQQNVGLGLGGILCVK